MKGRSKSLPPARTGGMTKAGKRLVRALGEVLADVKGEKPLPVVAVVPARLKDRSKEQLRRIQMVYQMPDVALNPRHSVLQVIGRPMRFYFGLSRKEIWARVGQLLRQIDLDESMMTRPSGELSGGQKQRVCIARALAARPDLIICDEVTASLDQLVGEEILSLLMRLQDTLGVAYLFITHDLGVVKRIADSLAVMMKGRIVALGDTASLFTPPLHPYTELLLSSVPEMRTGWLDDVLERRAARRGD